MGNFNWQSGDDVSMGGGFLEEPGTYHVTVTAVDEDVTKKDGSLIDNAAFRTHLEVCSGTVEGQKGKTKDVVFFRPKASQANDGAFARKRIDRMFLATNLMTLEQLGKPGDFDLQAMVGQQLVVKFIKEKADSQYVDLSFCDIYHIDDPAVANIPKNADMLKYVPPQFRGAAGRVAAAETVASSAAGKNGSGKAAGKPAATVDVNNMDL